MGARSTSLARLLEGVLLDVDAAGGRRLSGLSGCTSGVSD